MYPESGPKPIRQSSSVDGRPSAGTNLSTTAEVIAARLTGWAATHGMADDALLISTLQKVIEHALSEYFRFLTCDGNLMVLSRAAAGGNAMLLILQPGERYWRVAYENLAAHTDVPAAMLGELLDGVRKPCVETAARCRGWTLTREDFPLDAFIRS
jgi:hypothetical protein